MRWKYRAIGSTSQCDSRLPSSAYSRWHDISDFGSGQGVYDLLGRAGLKSDRIRFSGDLSAARGTPEWRYLQELRGVYYSEKWHVKDQDRLQRKDDRRGS